MLEGKKTRDERVTNAGILRCSKGGKGGKGEAQEVITYLQTSLI